MLITNKLLSNDGIKCLINIMYDLEGIYKQVTLHTILMTCMQYYWVSKWASKYLIASSVFPCLPNTSAQYCMNTPSSGLRDSAVRKTELKNYCIEVYIALTSFVIFLCQIVLFVWLVQVSTIKIGMGCVGVYFNCKKNK